MSPAVLLLAAWAADPASAQRVAAPEAPPVAAPRLPGASGVSAVPSLAPSLSPSLALPPNLSPVLQAVPAPVPAVAAAVPAARAALPAAAVPAAQALAEAASPDALDDDALLALTKRLAGEGGASVPGDYLRADKPFAFAAGPAEAYRSAKLDAAFSLTPERAGALIAAAKALAESAGIGAVEFDRPAPDGGTHKALRVLPEKDGTPLNALAYALEQGHGVTMLYVPQRTRGAAAAFNGAEKALFLPDFDREESYEAVLHEARHAHFTTRLASGRLSVFHAAVVAFEGMAVARGASTYTNYLSLEELSTYPKTLKHLSAALRRGPNPAKLALLRAFAGHYADIVRSARYNTALLRSRLANGTLVTRPVIGESWPAFPGGRWERVDLPHGVFALPVRDRPEPAPAPWWKKPFARKPETAGAAAVRGLLAALDPLVPKAEAALAAFAAEAEKTEPDPGKLSALADRLVAAARTADEAFAAGLKP